jgi:hypothetical protein
MQDRSIAEVAVRCLARQFPPGPTSLTALVDSVNAELLEHALRVTAPEMLELMATDPRVLVEDRDGAPWVRLMSSVDDEEARARLVEILLEAATFDELSERVTAEFSAKSSPLFGYALRLLAEGKPNGLDDPLMETFARALERFTDAPRAAELAAILRAHASALRRP